MSIHYTYTLSHARADPEGFDGGEGVSKGFEGLSEPRLIQNFILNLIFFYIIFKIFAHLTLTVVFLKFQQVHFTICDRI